MKATGVFLILNLLIACSSGTGTSTKDASDTYEVVKDQLMDQAQEVGNEEGQVTEETVEEIVAEMVETKEDIDIHEASQDTTEVTQEVVPEVTLEVKETTEEIKPTKSAMFRFSSLQINEPHFCFPGAKPCSDVTPVVNDYLKKSISDKDQPLNILLYFEPMDVTAQNAILKMGTGSCQFAQDVAVSCSFSNVEEPITFEGPIFHNTGECEPQVSAPCFITEKQAMELLFMSIFLTFQEGYISGHFDNNNIKTGHISAFIPVNTTKGVLITLPGSGDVKLYDFLELDPVYEVDGVQGYWFDFSFTASQVNMM